MNHTRTSQLKTLLIAVALTLSLSSCAPDAPAQAHQMDWMPPAFDVALDETNRFRYPEDLQSPVIVLFWATWCPYCKALMPHLQSILDEYPGELELLAINFREDGDPAAVLESRGYQFMLIPEADDVAKAWGVKGTPGLYLADETGRIVFSRFAIPETEFSERALSSGKKLSNSQKASRMAPFWAARLRTEIDLLLSK